MLTNSSGIYMIINKNTEQVYVGSAVNLRKRKASHFSKLSKGKHHSIKLQRSYHKHGEDAFSFVVLEVVPIPQLIVREQFWLDRTTAYGEGYNMQPNAYNSTGIKRSESFKEKCRQRMLGTVQSAEVKAKRLKNPPAIKDEDRFRRPVEQLSKGQLIQIHGSIKEAGTTLSICTGHISSVCQGNRGRKTAGGYEWRYAC